MATLKPLLLPGYQSLQACNVQLLLVVNIVLCIVILLAGQSTQRIL